MITINSDLIKEAVYNLCVKANTQYNGDLYKLLLDKYNTCDDFGEKARLCNILINIKLAYDKNRPLCQDTGQVIVFVEIGQNVNIVGTSLLKSINEAVEKAYGLNFYRKSVVKNALFDRTNTTTNTPVVVYTDIVDGDFISIKLMVKGAGSENYSNIKMFKPSATFKEIFEFIKDTLTYAGEKSCPPFVIGLGFGNTMDAAAVLSKKAFFKDYYTNDETDFINELKIYLSDFDKYILDIKILSEATHIASLPCAVTINCHSTRHACCDIFKNRVVYRDKAFKYKDISAQYNNFIEVSTSDIELIKNLKVNDKILLSGEVYTARDAAHKKIFDYYNANGRLPFDIKDKIIFYAGPCPAAPGEIIGPIGPTTSARMDEYCEFMHSNGLLASIGKGERSTAATDVIINKHGRYFTAQGGVACLLSDCVKESAILAFEELGTEAVRKLVIEKFPLTVEI